MLFSFYIGKIVIYLLQLEGADKQKYKQLYKIGVTFKGNEKSCFDRNWCTFLVSVHRATIHSDVALGALQKLFKLEVGAAAVIVMGIFLLLQIVISCY
jgi:putative ABC transport system permease protein